MGDEMLNTVKAIKTALGGESGGETYGSELLNTVIEIKDLVENGGGGGSSLPSYTDADKGKVLGLAETDGTVAPAWVNGGGGGDVFEVNYTFNTNDGTTFTGTSDKTYSEIVEAHTQGKAVLANVSVYYTASTDPVLIQHFSVNGYYYGAVEVLFYSYNNAVLDTTKIDCNYWFIEHSVDSGTSVEVLEFKQATAYLSL